MNLPETIELTFRHADTGDTVATLRVPADSIPEDLSRPTNIDLGDQQFTVVSADPTTRAAARLRGCVEISVRPLETADPSEVLYSLPTLEGQLPPVDETQVLPEGQIALLHEDEWRQMEFIAAVHEEAVTQEMQSIQRIIETAKPDAGFDAIHIRQGVPAPLAGSDIALDEVQALFPQSRRFQAVTFEGWEHPMIDAFAIETAGGILLYGQAPAGRLASLGLVLLSPTEQANEDLNVLFGLARRAKLLFVNWCGMQCLRPE